MRAGGSVRGQVDGKAADTLLWPVQGREMRQLLDLQVRGCLPTHTRRRAPTHVNTMGCQGWREVRRMRSLLWLKEHMRYSCGWQFSPDSTIHWTYDAGSTLSFLSLLFLFCKMGIIISTPPKILPSSWHLLRGRSHTLAVFLHCRCYTRHTFAAKPILKGWRSEYFINPLTSSTRE